MSSRATFTADDRRLVSAVDTDVIEYIIQQCVEILSRHIVFALVSTPRLHTEALEARENRFPFGVGNITIVCPTRASYICTQITTRTQSRIAAIYGDERVLVQNIQTKHDHTDAFIGDTDNRIWYPLLNVQISPVLLKSIGGQNTYAMASWSTGDTLVKTVKPCTPNDVAELLIANGNYSADVVYVNEPFSGGNLVYDLDAPDTSKSVYPISVPIFLGNAESDTLSLGTPYREDRTALLTASAIKEGEHPFAQLIATLDEKIDSAIKHLKTEREIKRTLLSSRIQKLSMSTTDEHTSQEKCSEMASILEILVWRTMYGELNPIDPPMSMAEETGPWLYNLQKGYDEIYLTTNTDPEQLANRRLHLKNKAPLFHIPLLMSIAQHCKLEFETHVARQTQLVPVVANYFNSDTHFADRKDQRERMPMIINGKAHFVDCSATEWQSITRLPQPVFKTIPLHLTVQRALYDSDNRLFESHGNNPVNAISNLQQAVQSMVYSPSMLFSLRACMNPKPSDPVYTNIRPFPYMERVLIAAICYGCGNNALLASANSLGSQSIDIALRGADPNIRDANDVDLKSISRYNYYMRSTSIPPYTGESEGEGPITAITYGLESNLGQWDNDDKPDAQLHDLYIIDNARACRMKELDTGTELAADSFVPNVIRRTDESDGIWSKTLRKLRRCDVQFADLVESPIVTIPGFKLSDDPITMMQQHCIYTHRQNATHRNALTISHDVIEKTLFQMKWNLFRILDTEHNSLDVLPENFRMTLQNKAKDDLRKIANAIQKIGGIPAAIEPGTFPDYSTYWLPDKINMTHFSMTDATECVKMLHEGSDGIWSKCVSEFLMDTPAGIQIILAAGDFMRQLRDKHANSLFSGYAFAVYTQTQLAPHISHIEEEAPLSTFDNTVQRESLQEVIKNCKTHRDVLEAEELVRAYLCKHMCIASRDHLVDLSGQNDAGKRQVYGINERFAILYSNMQPLNLDKFSALIKTAEDYATTWFAKWQSINAPDRQLAVVHFNMYSYSIFENLVHYTREEEDNGEVTHATIIECLTDNDDKYTWMRRCLSRLCHPVELTDDMAPIHLKTYGLQCVGYTPYRTPFIMTDCHISDNSRFNRETIEPALLARLTRKAIHLRQTCMIKTEIDVLKQFLHLNNSEDKILINWIDSSVASLHIKDNKCMLTLGTLSEKTKTVTRFTVGNHTITSSHKKINMSNTTCIPIDETNFVKGTPKPHANDAGTYRFENASEITSTVIDNRRHHNVLLFVPSVDLSKVSVEVSVDDIRKYNAEIEECLLLNTYKMMQDPVIDWHFEPISLVTDYAFEGDKKVATKLTTANVGIAGHNGYAITSGIHYWELETQNIIPAAGFYFGVCRAGIDPCTDFIERDETWLMFTHDSTWEYKGARPNQGTGMLATPLPNISTDGKKIGLLLNMEDGTLTMFLDKKPCGTIANNLNGPLLPCILLPGVGSKVKIHGNMVPPPPQSYPGVLCEDLTVNQHKTLMEYVTTPKHFPLDNNAFCAEYGYQLALFSDTIPEKLPIELATCSECDLNLRQLADGTQKQCKLSSCKVSDACIWCTFPVERKNAAYSQCIKQLPRFWDPAFKEEVTAESPFHAECLAKLYSTGVHLFGNKQLVDPRGQTDAYCSFHNKTVTFADTLDFEQVDTFLNDTKQLTYIEVHIQMAHLGLLLRQGLNKSPAAPISKCTVCQKDLHTVTEAERGMHTLCQYNYYTSGMTASCEWCKNPAFSDAEQFHTTCDYISTKYAHV